MKLDIRYWLLFAFCSFFLLNIVSAQNCSVLFSGNIPFKISLNKIEQHRNFETQLYLDSLTANNKYFAEITFKNDSTVKRKTLYLFDDGFIHLYDVSKNGLQLKKMQPELTYQLPENITKQSYTGKALPLIVAADTVKKDTNYIPPFEEYYKLDDYAGKIGCPFPIKEDEFNAFYIKLKQISLDEDKLVFIKEKLDAACLLTTQLSKVFEVIEYEDVKLKLGLFIYPKTFDVDHFFDIAKKHLKFESHIEEIRETYNIKND